MPIVPPEDYDEAVKPLPADQTPYGNDCQMATKIQAILFHYEITADEAAMLMDQGFFVRKHFKAAHPDGDQDQKDAYDGAVNANIDKPLRRKIMLQAFRRILSKDPMAAIAAPAPPLKKQKVKASDASGATAAATGNDPPPSTSGKAAPVSKKSKKSSNDGKGDGKGDDDDDVNDDDDDFSDSDSPSIDSGADASDNDADDGDKESKEKSSSSRRDLNSLFDDVSNEVPLQVFSA